MASAVKVEMPDGKIIWARVETGAGDVASSSVVRKLDLDDLKSSVRAVSSAVREATTELLPDVVTVEFGFELAMKAGKLVSVLAEVEGKASLKVSMSWSAAELPGNA